MTGLSIKAAFARLLIASIALPSAGWALFFLSNDDRSIQFNYLANRIMSGDRFRQNPLPGDAEIRTVESRPACNPLEARAAPIIRLRQFEDAVNASDTRLADQRLQSLRASVDLALRCVPTEGFLWFIRYWSAVHRGASASDHFDELRMSYAFSPFEGWIALRRSPYVLAVYEALPDDLKDNARKEFAAIVASGFIDDAARILKGSAWDIRDELLPHIATARLELRIALERRLRADGFPTTIPGVETPEFRPWR